MLVHSSTREDQCNPEQNDNSFSNLQKSVVSLSSKLARNKSQRMLLDTVLNWDLCTSIRPKIGKIFNNPDLESLKCQYLEECREKIVQVSMTEADNNITLLKRQLNDIFHSCQSQISRSNYIKLCKLAQSNESTILLSQKKKHRNKLVHYCKKNSKSVPVDIIPVSSVYSKPEKTVKHYETKRDKRIRRNYKRRRKAKLKRNGNLQSMVESIKSSGLVVNFTEVQVLDCAYVYLSKGCSFVPAVSASKHDLIFDTTEFLRKLSWRTFFNSRENSENQNNPSDDVLDSENEMIKKKLRLPSNNWPSISNKLLDNVCGKINNFVESMDISNIKKYKNLSYVEKKGLLWCIKMKNTHMIHFSQADKGGAIVLMDPKKVNSIILSELENICNYTKLLTDPRFDIGNRLNALCLDNIKNKGLTENEHFLITGHTDKGKSHNPLLKAGKPTPFPLFKLHSLKPEDIAAKNIPPHRLVTSMKYGPTKRSSLFIGWIAQKVVTS